MAIADTITSMQTHTSNAYTMIGYGTDLTGINKNLANLSSTIFEAFLESLRNPDTLFTNLPKITGSGSVITLNDTANAPMRITLGASELTQDGTPTPSSPQDIHTISGSNTISIYGKNLLNLELGEILSSDGSDISATTVCRSKNYIPIEYNQSVIASGTINGMPNIRLYDSNKNYIGYAGIPSTGLFTNTNTQAKYFRIRYPLGNYTFEQIKNTLMMEYGETASTFTPHVSQTADVDLESKNRFNIKTIIENTYLDGGTGSTGTSSVTNLSDYIEIKSNTDYHLDYDYSTLLNTGSRSYCFYDSSKTYLSGNSYSATDKKHTITTPSSAKYIRFAYDKNCNDIIFSKENISYEEYYNYGEYGSIGNYENIPIRTSGKQLFMDNFIPEPNQNINAKLKAGTYTLATCDSNNFGTNVYFKLYKNNTTITTSGHLTSTNATLNFSTSSYNYYGGNDTSYVTFTIDDDYDIAIGLLSSTGTRRVMLTNGSEIVRTYEPYGNGTWYLKQEIGKVVLDGTNYLAKGTTGTNAYYLSTNIYGLNDNNAIVSYSNMFQPVSFANRVNGLDVTYSQNGNINLRTANNTSIDWSTEANCKTWLNANTPTLYYILATPTYTKITGTLAEQLENVYQKMLSQAGQTNISQENDDLSFNLSVQAIEDLV